MVESNSNRGKRDSPITIPITITCHYSLHSCPAFPGHQELRSPFCLAKNREKSIIWDAVNHEFVDGTER